MMIGMSLLNTPGATGPFMFIVHLLLNNHLEDKIFLSLVQKEGNQNFWEIKQLAQGRTI